MLLTDVLDVLMIFRRRNCQQQKRSRFVRLSGDLKSNSVGRFVQRMHIVYEAIVADMPFTNFMADDRCGCWNRGVISDSFREIIRQFYLCSGEWRDKRKGQKQ